MKVIKKTRNLHSFRRETLLHTSAKLGDTRSWPAGASASSSARPSGALSTGVSPLIMSDSEDDLGTGIEPMLREGSITRRLQVDFVSLVLQDNVGAVKQALEAQPGLADAYSPRGIPVLVLAIEEEVRAPARERNRVRCLPLPSQAEILSRPRAVRFLFFFCVHSCR